MTATNAASLGSIQAHAQAVGARVDDDLLLVFDTDTETVEFSVLDPTLTGTRRLRQLLGKSVRNPAAALAASLECPRSQVVAILRRRRDEELAALVEECASSTG